ncbi:MAG TPA: triose-phosphate isomerase [Patescibacteria group bacterium]|nr:triose-phosphate isomerase [Patescibacteria group bacterium]
MKYVFGNWKMYLNAAETVALATGLKNETVEEKVSVAVFPLLLSVQDTAEILKNTEWRVGAQNVSWTPQGAYTGAVSALMFKDIGCEYALVGHSERRHIFGESDTAVRKKIEACLDAGLTPVLCVGETKEEKDEGKREYRLKKQLYTALDGLTLNGRIPLIAYEPVWAIGTGTPCLPADADDVQGWIKKEAQQYLGTEPVVLYGGSVTPENVLSYLTLPTCDGVLVGGASTKQDSFLALIRAAASI